MGRRKPRAITLPWCHRTVFAPRAAIHRTLWFLLLVMIPLRIVRARQEARVLEATFGDAYREYRRRTWF